MSLNQHIRSVSPVKLLLSMLFIAVLIWCGFWFFQNFERVEKTDYQLNNRVAYNPFYAAELLINSRDMANSDDENIAYTDLDGDLKSLIDNLPAINEQSEQHPTLLINSIGGTLNSARFEKLRSWIEQGGHVITFTQTSIADDDLEQLLARLQVLKEQVTQQSNNSNPAEMQKMLLDVVNNDAEFNKLLAELNSNNQLLLRLGIFSVYQGSERDEELSALISEISELEADVDTDKSIPEDNSNNSNNDKARTEAIRVNKAKLLDELNSIFYSVTPLSINEGADGSAIIMVQNARSSQQINSEIFKQLYATEQSLQTVQSLSNHQLAQQVRHYLQQQLDLLPKPEEDKVASSSDQTKTKNVPNKNKEKQLASLLTEAIKLDDDTLLQLFNPADHVFFDSSYGKGRISVLIDSQSFTNPDPNLDLVSDEAVDNVFNTERKSPLNEVLLDPLDGFGYRVNLASMDNALWLLELTKDSSQVLILPNIDVDTLPEILWKQARLAIFGLLLLVIIWLWSLYDRFGKMQYLADNQAHDILRYFQQVGYYGWKQDSALKLTQATQQQISQLLQKHLPQLSSSTATETELANIDKLLFNLQQLLSKRLQDRLQLYTKHAQDDKYPTSNMDGWIDNTMRNHQEKMQQAISMPRLQSAVAPILSRVLPEHLPSFDAMQINTTTQTNERLSPKKVSAKNVNEFTEMTQTLWIVQWLLKVN